MSRWSKEVKELREEALEQLQVVVEEFNLRVPKDKNVRFSWGYNTETGLKEISTATPAPDSVGYACDVFNSLYKQFSISGCEASFHFITDDEGWFKEMEISSISLPIFTSLEAREGNAKRLVEEAKKEHTVYT